MAGLVRAPRRPPGWAAPGPVPAGPRGRPELSPADDEDLCYLAGDWRLFQKRRGHRFSLDDLITAWIATRALARDASGLAIDLGCGLGSVLLMVAWRQLAMTCLGIEAQADRAALGRRSIAYNGVDDRCRIIDGDLRDGIADVAPHSAALVTGTPPYFPRGSGTESDKPHAMPCRFELRGGIEAYLAAAASLVADDGRVVVCSAAIEAPRVIAGAAQANLAIAEHWDVVPREGKAPLVMVDVLVPAIHGTSARPVHRAITVRDRAGQWTPEFRSVRDDLGMPSEPPARR